jgi:hypothetical protein
MTSVLKHIFGRKEVGSLNPTELVLIADKVYFAPTIKISYTKHPWKRNETCSGLYRVAGDEG